MNPVAWIKKVFTQEAANDCPQIVEILATSFCFGSSPRGQQTHGSTMRGSQVVQTVACDKALAVTGLPQGLARLRVRNLHGKRRASLQRYLPVEQCDCLGCRQPEPGEHCFRFVLSSGSMRARMVSVLAMGSLLSDANLPRMGNIPMLQRAKQNCRRTVGLPRIPGVS